MQDEKDAVRCGCLAVATIIAVALFMQQEEANSTTQETATADREKTSPKRETMFPAVASTGPSMKVKKAYRRYDVKDAKGSFEKVCGDLIDETCAELKAHETRESEIEWVRKMLEYNVVGGKMNRGLMVVEAGRLLFEGRGMKVTNDDLNKFCVLGWCVEWLQAWLLVADDYMDSSVTRRGRPCWFRVEGVDKIAINDAFLIEMCLFKTLKRHFLDAPLIYAQLVDLFLETQFQTELGQLLDLRCEHVPLKEFTQERWTLIVKYKTAFYSFYLPVAMAMILAGIDDKSEFDAARDILLVMGIYFQAQDDYLDAFGTPERIGKIGTDIQDKKCGWLFVNAYHDLCDDKQRAFLDLHYGKCKVQTPEETAIKKLYTDLGLPKLYADYEQASYDKIMQLKSTVKQVPWAVFEAFLHKIYKRQK